MRQSVNSPSRPLPRARHAAEPAGRRAARWRDSSWLDLALIAGFWLVFFWPVLIRQDYLIPYDLIDQHYMFQAFVHRALAAGDAPWWAPEILGGYPMVADPLAALFYPPNLLMHALVRQPHLPYLALEWQLALHYLWAALGAYVLARWLTGSRPGALLAALVYGFGSFFAMHAPHLAPVSALSWLPWIVAAYVQALRTRGLAWIGLAAALTGLMMLTGHALTMLQTVYLLAAIGAILVWRRWRADRATALGTAAAGAGVLLLGVALATVQLLPSWELSARTERADFGYQAATASSVAPHWVVTLVLPNFFSHDGRADYWGSGDPAETILYAGLLPLFLAGLALTRARDGERRLLWLLLAGVVVALVLAFGSGTWLYRVAYDLLPGVDRVRRPANYVALMQLGLGLLAAYGVKVLSDAGGHGRDGWRALRGWVGRALALTALLIALAALALATFVGQPAQPALMTVLDGLVIAGVVLLALAAVLLARLWGWISARLALGALLLIAAVDLSTATAGKVWADHPMPPDSYIGADWAGGPDDPSVRLLQRHAAELAPERGRVWPYRAGSIWENGPLVWGIESIGGYSVLWPTEYRELYEAAVADPNGRIFDLLNVRYLLLPEPIEQLMPAARADKFRPLHEGGPWIYENVEALPRVWVAHEWTTPDAGSALDHLRDHQAEIGAVVVLDQPPADAPPSDTGGPTGSAEIVHYGNTRVLIRASLPRPGFLILADSYYPGWEASAGGEPAPLHRAYHALRAVALPAGEHEVELRFAPASPRLGAMVSSLALIGCLGLIVGGALTSLMRTRGAARARAPRATGSRGGSLIGRGDDSHPVWPPPGP